MKTVFLLAVVFLTGCANFDAEKFNKAFNESLQQQQRNQQIIQSMQPYTIPQQKIHPQQPMVLTGFLQQTVDNGNVRYCKYSNGVINTISTVSLCPLNTQ
jgi:outer membrane biogenesis lipoprotein LolB